MGLSQSTPDSHHGYEYHHHHHQQNHNRSYQPRSSRPRPRPRRTSFPSSAAAAIPTMPTFFSFQQGSERAQNTRYHFTEASPLLGRFRAVPRPADRIAANSGRRISSSVRGHGKGQGVGLGLGSGSGGQGLLSVHNGGGVGGGGGSGIEDLGPGWRGSVHVGYGYGALAAAMESDGDGDDDEDDDDEEDEDGEERHAGCCCSGDGRFWRRLNRRVTRGWRRFGDTWVDPKASVVRKVVDVWWSRWTALVVFPALLVGVSPQYSARAGLYDPGGWLAGKLIFPCTGCGVVCCTIPPISASR